MGKTTLAREIAAGEPSLYLDLENSTDRAKLDNPELFFSLHEDVDEFHRVPELFASLRGIIDEGRRKGLRTLRFLVLGSAAIELMRQSETLAGRIAYVNLGPLDLLETDHQPATNCKLWLRGGFQDSYLAATDRESLSLRRDFIRTYLERDVPMFGPRIPAETLERLWTILKVASSTHPSSRLASGISVTSPTVGSYLGLLVDLLLVRRLAPIPPQHRQAPRQVTQNLHPRQRPFARPAWYWGFRYSAWTPGDRHELGGICH